MVLLIVVKILIKVALTGIFGRSWPHMTCLPRRFLNTVIWYSERWSHYHRHDGLREDRGLRLPHRSFGSNTVSLARRRCSCWGVMGSRCRRSIASNSPQTSGREFPMASVGLWGLKTGGGLRTADGGAVTTPTASRRWAGKGLASTSLFLRGGACTQVARPTAGATWSLRPASSPNESQKKLLANHAQIYNRTLITHGPVTIHQANSVLAEKLTDPGYPALPVLQVEGVGFLEIGTEAQQCVSRKYDQDSIVCVCNATYCDLIEPTTVDQLAGNVARHYISTIEEGIEYSFVRVPMGGSDFSTHYYAYDDVVNDTSLKYFNLTQEDYLIKIPYLKRAQSLSNRPLKLFTTAWSAPDWMKNIVTMGNSSLKPEYYQLWADYYVKFLDAYAEEDLHFWGITPQNEPSHGRVFDNAFNSIGWTADQQLEWVVGNLAPTLEENGYSDLELMILDDQPDEFYKQPMFYALAHFSKFVPPGSVRIGLETKNNSNFIENVAFLTEDGVKVIILQNNTKAEQCVARKYDQESIVCVCNATYCDLIEPTTVDQLVGNVARHYISTIEVNIADAIYFQVNENATYQQILGFGGAMTDSAAINIDSLSESTQQLLLSAYYSPEGIEYSFLRTHIGSSDFSTHYYSLDDVVNDTTLEYFNLTKEDYSLKIPNIKRAQSLSNGKVKLFTTAWSAPDWMKNLQTNGLSSLKPEYYQLWADYYIKYLDAYAAEDIHFWGLTPQNEPDHGHLYYEGFNSMGWSAEQQLDWVVVNLGPALEKNGYSELELMVLDDQRVYLANWVETIFKNETAKKFTSGVAIHWYLDSFSGSNHLDAAHEAFPDKFLLYTEACITDEFYKQPMFYALAHFSKFVPPGSVHIGLETENNSKSIENVAFLTEDGVKVIILQNNAYFSPEGLEYSFVRVPMGGSDFSTHYYAYDDVVNDYTLRYFNLTEEDYLLKIPNIKRAQSLSNGKVKLFTTAWSAPDWMKNIQTSGLSSLKPEYYQLWADYYIKFLDAYAAEDVHFWGLTPQNEPSHGRILYDGFNSMGWTADQQREWVVGNLAPTLEENGYSDLELMILDDQRFFLTDWVDTVTNHWVVGWVDWNLVLDLEGGPNWANNTVDSPIIVNATADEFYKQPMFYALAHFSKFVPPGSVRIGLETKNNSNFIENVAFLTEDVSGKADQCVPRSYDQDSVICVCNATYCDLIEPTTVDQLAGNVARHYISTIEVDIPNATYFQVNKNVTYQQILGFGGAMTDSAAINIDSLSEETQNRLLSAYFSPEGITYSFVRVPMGGSDFSTHYYAYDDVVNDSILEYFNLTEEDYLFKIPSIKRAQSLSNVQLKLFTTAWSAPDWMKNIQTNGMSSLKQEYYQLWADYYVKFLDAYAEEDVHFWGLTPQNEPSHGSLLYNGFNSMGWTAEQQMEWVVGNLAPTLKENGYSDLELMILDDQLHSSRQAPVFLGSWSRGEAYMSSIIEVTNHWVTGWVDWNLVLDLEGGPNWANNTVDSPIIVNATADEFYKQPMFYALAHFSKFVPPGSVRIGLETENNSNSIENVAFLTEDGVKSVFQLRTVYLETMEKAVSCVYATLPTVTMLNQLQLNNSLAMSLGTTSQQKMAADSNQ
uniref:Glucosylceramidase n=1 Tax=Timema monikensis TaxID=170555 RepID=A0A7R9HHT0_9NEOP|nr:unnamed protein product [Timema monikensis]